MERTKKILSKKILIAGLSLPIFSMVLGCATIKKVEGKYAYPEKIASTEWLNANLTNKNLRIVDCRVPQSDSAFDSGHIPGAVKLDVLANLSNPKGNVPFKILPLRKFAELMGQLGISNSTTVVVYDTSGGFWAARLWWALMYYGHDDVRMLNGGLGKWMREGRQLETGQSKPPKSKFRAKIRPEFIATIDDVKEAIKRPDIHIIDALPEYHHSGKRTYHPLIGPAGHIPTSKNIPAISNFDRDEHTLLSPGELRELWGKVKVTPGDRIIIYCGGGYFGAFDLFVLYQLGYKNISLYDGSWVEWTSNPDLPVEP